MTTVKKTPTKKVVETKEIVLAVIKGVDLTSGVKVFTVPFKSLYVEKDFNIRDIDQEHVKGFADSYKAKRHVPSVSVKHTEKGLKVIEGHHRYFGGELAKLKEINIELFQGTPSDEIAYMVTSSQGRNLEPLERAAAYQRLLDAGTTKTQIHKLTGRSRTDIDRHLTLLTANARIQTSLRKGEVGFKAVVEELGKAKDSDAILLANKNLEVAIKEAKKINKMVTTKVMNDSKAAASLPSIANDKNLSGDKPPKTVDKNKPTAVIFSNEDALKVVEIMSGYDADYLGKLNKDLPALILKYVSSGA